ncbi:hypothetical protein [Hymenobacter coccineus]|uniref:hypothetical protein n=1 Tax=Hymenobacter coccineus TaxID=1908235 RepID=UPI00114D2CC2|nr:hypothetical protein [Hymenobacter coccineus]
MRLTLAELESFFEIKLDLEEINRVFDDAENDQLSFKYYIFYKEKGFLLPNWEISGAVDEHEPETLFLKSIGGFGKRKRFDIFFERNA